MISTKLIKEGFNISPVVRGANVSVFLGGLAVTNDARTSWQSLFLDGVDGHELRIEVLKTRNGDILDEQYFKTGAIEKGRSLSINSGSGIGTSTYSGPDERDYSLILDFAGPKLHKGPVRLKQPEGLEITKLEVDGGMAYTAALATPGENNMRNYYLLSPGETAKPEDDDRFFHLGTWMGIDQSIDPGSVLGLSCKSDVSTFEQKTLIESGTEYKIFIYNTCFAAACLYDIDFPYYYHDLHNTKRGIVNMTPFKLGWDPSNLDTKMLGHRVDCNKMVVSEMDNINSLFDLAP